MAEQIYPLTFEGREFNPQMLGGSVVLKTPLKRSQNAQTLLHEWRNNSHNISQDPIYQINPTLSMMYLKEQNQMVLDLNA